MSKSPLDLISHPSPNFGERRNGAVPELVVLHYTAMDSAEAALQRLCDPQAEVSAHYLIAADGRVWRLVEEKHRAWHAGAGSWAGQDDVNSRSIGIELDNTGTHPFAEPQIAALEDLMQGIMTRWSIPPRKVIAHSDMAPDRKLDPGPRFDWRRLALQGLSVWPSENAVNGHDPSWFRDFAHAFGYPESATNEELLRAFRFRFRPGKTGPVDAIDLKLIQSLVANHVDPSPLNA